MNQKSCRGALLAGTALLCITGGAQTALAQDTAQNAAQDASAPQSETAPAAMNDIVVTARRRAESAQEVPVAVTVISAQDIARRDLTSLERIAAATPQLVIGRNVSGSGAQLTLRGIGSNSLSIGVEQSVAVIVDGVYYGQGRTINEGFFDLASMEILKGPQSLFFGKNATAGVISITTANPTDHFTAQMRTGYEFNAQKVYAEGFVSGPIGDTAGFRLAVRGSKDFGSLFDNRAGPITYNTRDTPTATTVAPNTAHTALPSKAGPRERDILVRGTLRWEPTDDLTATVKANYGWNRTYGGAWNYNVFACDGGTSTTTPGVACTPGFYNRMNDLPKDIADQTALVKDHNFNDYRSWGVTGNIDYQLGDLAVTSVTNYNFNRNHWTADIDYQSSPTVNIWGGEVSRWKAFSQELRVLSQFDGPLNFLVGGYYQNTKRTFDQVVINANAENSAAPEGYRYVQYAKESTTDGETLSGYGQLIWKVIPEIEVTGGVRYIHETKDSTFFQPYANPRFAGVNYDVTRRLAANQTFTNWSPEATVAWKVTPDINVYGAFKTAYKSGGFSNSSILTPRTEADFFTFDPEKGKGFEAGIKTMLFDRQLRFNVSLYTFKYTDLQVTYLDSAALSYNSVNAGSARTRGVEVEFDYAPRGLRGFGLNGSINYNKANYGDGIAPCYGGQSLANGCTPGLLVPPVPATGTTPSRPGTPGQNLDGVSTFAAPRWTATLGMKYDTDISDGLTAGFGVDSRYSSSYLTSAFGSPLSRQGSYINLDAQIHIRTADERWELALLGKNLTNRFVVTGVTDASGSGLGTGTNANRIADQAGFGAMPRTIALQLTWRMP
ncbi:TonB-dependent receptor [Novosphingobium sp. HR1a]|nr:TonB-dependent receptor [Novosphingobium sp. HR1a]MBF7014731.1 TonB-dependent receptor [Novosphingobium sp. HR1a]